MRTLPDPCSTLPRTVHAFRRIVSLIAAVLVLGVPGGALAQTPGDDQYTDPFGGSQEEPSNPPQDEPEPTPAPEPESTTEAPAPAATPAPATASQTTTDPSAQLPRTGGDPLPLAVAGFWLVLGGVALRARVRTR
jgi:hypothetical protein